MTRETAVGLHVDTVARRTLPVVLLLSTACATVPPPVAPVVSYEQKMAWMLQLEDQRILKLPPPPEPAVPPKGRRAAVVPPPPTSVPDLTVLVRDPEARVRRRAALAIGRTRLPEGVAPLAATLADTDPEVRAMAAFALGLIGDAAADKGLIDALGDPDVMVRGRAAEALGLIGADALGQTRAKAAAEAIRTMVADVGRSSAVTAMQPDDEAWPGAPEAEAFKLGLFAFVRLGAYESLASAVLENGTPVTTWWPVAYALQRVGDKRAVPALRQLMTTEGRYTRAFAARGLGAARDTTAVEVLLPFLAADSRGGLEVTVAAIRALGQIGASQTVAPLTVLVADPAVHANIRLEAMNALGSIGSNEGLPYVLDQLTAEWPAMRIAALQALAAIDRESFIFALATMEPDRDWRVRAALAGLLTDLPQDVALARLRTLLRDEDRRAIPAALAALARIRPPDLPSILFDHLKQPDFAIRAAAARQLGQVRPDGAAQALREAYADARADSTYVARAAALEALAAFGPAEALDTLKSALSDPEWAVRVRAAELIAKMDSSLDARAAIRPVPDQPVTSYDDPQLIGPPYSPHVFIETAKGTVEFELTVLDAPQTTRNFMALARKGFFNGLPVHRVVANFVVQDGDPRGDGQGGPGYTIRDELNDRPFLRGTVGMALSWPDTGGSQFFITHSPQPHLDARYAVFGRVVNGMEVVDSIAPGDVIRRVTVWNGKEWE